MDNQDFTVYLGRHDLNLVSLFLFLKEKDGNRVYFFREKRNFLLNKVEVLGNYIFLAGKQRESRFNYEKELTKLI